MKSTILVTAALLSTTMLANLAAAKPAAAQTRAGEPVSNGMLVSQNLYNGGGSEEFAAIVIIAGVAVACVAAAGGASKMHKPAAKSARLEPSLEPLVDDNPELSKQPVTSVPLSQSDTSSYIALAYAYFKQGDRAKAIEYFNEAIRINPDSAYIYGERANFRNKNLGDKQGAIEDYNCAIQIDPQNALFYFWRSQTYHELGNAQKAIEDYNCALSLAPENTMYYSFHSAEKSHSWG